MDSHAAIEVAPVVPNTMLLSLFSRTVSISAPDTALGLKDRRERTRITDVVCFISGCGLLVIHYFGAFVLEGAASYDSEIPHRGTAGE